MIHEVSSTLDPGISQLAYLFAIEPIPSSTVEFLVEIKDEFGVNEIDKSVSDITGVVMIYGKIKEIDLHFMVSADFFIQHLFGILVRDVSDHQCGPSV